MLWYELHRAFIQYLLTKKKKEKIRKCPCHHMHVNFTLDSLPITLSGNRPENCELHTSGSLSITRHSEHIHRWLWWLWLNHDCPTIVPGIYGPTRARASYKSINTENINDFHQNLDWSHPTSRFVFRTLTTNSQRRAQPMYQLISYTITRPVVIIHRRRKLLVVANPTCVAYITQTRIFRVVFVKVTLQNLIDLSAE